MLELKKENFKIWTIQNKEEERFLRKKTARFNFEKFSPGEITKLINHMRKIMKEANGIGLSANQIGLPYRFFVASPPEQNKFYAVFNPRVEKTNGKKIKLEEGCLSVPNWFGETLRYSEVIISGYNRYNKPIKIKAWDTLAHIFQHEIDHLEGRLFIDMAKEIKEINATEKQLG